ncbi:MAG: glycosyltransferase, partial [Lentisphaerae bacterium]
FKLTYNCLKSIADNTHGVDYEVIIADDNSSDETMRIFDYALNLVHIRDGKNRGFLLNCNHAAEYARGDYLLFLNNDTQVQPNWLKPMVDLMERDETVGMVGSKLLFPDGRLQEAGGIIWNDMTAWNFGRGDDPNLPQYNYVRDVDYVSGASMMIRHNLWLELKGFDPRFCPAYCEDTDLAFAVRDRGYRVVYHPKSVVVHFEGMSHGTDENQGIKQYQVVNQKKFFQKWKKVLKRNHFPNGEDVFLARDRSRYRKHILVIDHYIPHFDQDAGSRTLWQYLDLFVEMGMQVTFIGDNFYPHEPYLSLLQEKGVEVLYGPEAHQNVMQWLDAHGRYFDVVFLSRPHISIKYIDKLKTACPQAKLLYYGHDLHHVSLRRRYELTGDASLLPEMKKMEQIETKLFREVDVAFMLNDDEIAFVNKLTGSNKCRRLKCFFYPEIPTVEGLPFNQRENAMLFVGGFGHQPNVDGIVWFANEVLPKLDNILSGYTLYVAGSKPPEEVYALESERIKILGYVPDEELMRLYASCKVAVIPLRYGAGVKGKTVEALCAGLPVVSTPIGVEGMPEIEKVVNVCRDPEAFAESIARLFRDMQAWGTSVFRGVEYGQQYFSKESARAEFLEVIS